MGKRSLSNNSIVKTDDNSKDVKPFQLRSVSASGCGRPAVSGYQRDNKANKEEEMAYEKGFSNGINTGRLQILKEIESELKLLRSLIVGIEKVREEIYSNIESVVVEMAISIAKKIVYETGEHERDMVVAVAREAIKKASDREMLKIRVNPVDHEAINKSRTDLLKCLDGIKSIIIEEDGSIQPGGCLIETNQGDVDGRIDSQFRVIEEEMRRRRSEARNQQERPI